MPPNSRAIHRTARDMVYTHELFRILDCFREIGIDATPFKGPVLNATLYGDRAVREYSDLDILIRPRDMLEAQNVLCRLGYRTEHNLEDPLRSPVVRFIREVVFRHQNGNLVELHWHFAPFPYTCPVSPDEIWARRTSVRLEDRDVPSLGNEDLLLYLCFHGWKHQWASRGWVEDVARLLEMAPNLDWAWITAQARRTHTTRILLLGLMLATEIAGAPVPRDLIGRAEAMPAVCEMTAAASSRLAVASASRLNRSERVRFLRLGIESWHRRAFFGGAIALRPTLAEWRTLRLPAKLSFLYYPYRVFRLLAGNTRLTSD
jgi:putative nucleotidyltransferase-like protein